MSSGRSTVRRPVLMALAMAGVVLSVLIVSSVPVAAAVHLIPKLTDCYANRPPLSGSFVAGNACDNSTGTQYLDDGSAFPAYVAFNLTRSYLVDHVAVLWGNYPGTGHVDVWTGSTWVAYVNFTGGAGNSNQTITLDHQYVTQKVRVYATSSAVSAIYFGMFEVWVYGDVVAPSVTTNAASSVATTSATLNGDLTAKGTAATVSIGFRYGTSATLSGATNHTVSSSAAVGTFSYGVSSLTPGTKYYFEAWANGDGFVTGPILNFTTPTVPPSVSTVAASSVGTTTATLNGNLTSLGSAASVTRGFRYGTSSSLAGATNASVGSTSSTGAFSHGVTGLSFGTKYYFEAWALGDGFVAGSILNFTTGDFSLSVSPASGSFRLDGSGTVDVVVTDSGGFSGDVVIVVSVSNANLVAVCVPTVVHGNGSSVCTLSAAAPGTYTLSATGTNGTTNRTASGSVTVTPALSWTPTLIVLALLVFAIVLSLYLSVRFDTVLWLVPASVFGFALTFEAFTATSDLTLALVLISVSLILLAVPVAILVKDRRA